MSSSGSRLGVAMFYEGSVVGATESRIRRGDIYIYKDVE